MENVESLKGGHVNKGGINDAPKVQKQNIKPPAREKQTSEKGKKIVIIDCPHCGQHTCHVEKYSDIKSAPKNLRGYFCKNCGMTSSSEFKEKSKMLEHALKTMPDMIRDMKFYDDKLKIYFFLAVIQMPAGNVFPEPMGKDWQWTYMPVVEINESEANKYPVPNKKGEYYSHRLAEEQAVRFDKTDFKSAIARLGLV